MKNNFIINCLKGIGVGAVAIIPGISSGVICVILGIYEKLLNSVMNFFKDIKTNLKFLFPIILGIGIGAAAGALIGKKMDKQKAELEKIENVEVETVTDANDLQALKVTLPSGILFATNSSELSASARESLKQFAVSLQENPDTDITIYGHTDNTGSRAVNEKLSKERAMSVANFLVGNSISRDRMTTEGLAYDVPVADNSTAEGRALNRRVEVYITANENMIQQAEQGTLK